MYKNSLIFLFFTSVIALISAYSAQFIFDLQPCVLCLYQRQPFFAIIVLTAASLVFFKKAKLRKIIFICCIILLSINVGIAAYQVGVEQKIFKVPTTCSTNEAEPIKNIEELKAALLQAKMIRCDEPQFFFLKLSMAAWNVIYCGLLIALALFFSRKNSNHL